MRPAENLARLLCAGAVAGLLASCALTRPPHGYTTGALYMDPSDVRRDQLNCPREDCERWFRTRLRKPGDLSIRVDAATVPAALRYSVVLMDSRGVRTLGRASNEGRADVSMARELQPNTYLIGVVSDSDGQAFDFDVVLAFDAAPPPQQEPEPPKFETHSSAVLESVGYGRDTVAVLIGSGQKRGMQVGFRGKLFDDGKEIGSVVIETVYLDGSRARVEGALSSPVTHATIARIEVPVGLGLGDSEPEDSEGDPFDFPPSDEDDDERDR